VAQPWAGKGYGMTHIPRIGQEVVVHFLEGDPDQPLIIGSVYNAEQTPPFPLPASKMVMGLKSNTTPGGGGMNEFSLNDTKGKELINVHGQYDMKTEIQHDDTQIIHNNRTITVDGTHTETIKKATTIKITEGPFSFSVVANTASYFVKGAVDISYTDKLDVGVVGPVSETFTDTQTTTVKNAIMVKSTAAGIEINGSTEIKLISGLSSITLKSDGTIDISGENITISGKATAKIGTGNQNLNTSTSVTSICGAEISSGTDSTGKHSIVGAVVKIN
jgi:type VI secretion system secreted protein VgrG